MSRGEGGGVRKVPKKCHVLFEWPLFPFLFYSTFENCPEKEIKQSPNLVDDNKDKQDLPLFSMSGKEKPENKGGVVKVEI